MRCAGFLTDCHVQKEREREAAEQGRGGEKEEGGRRKTLRLVDTAYKGEKRRSTGQLLVSHRDIDPHAGVHTRTDTDNSTQGHIHGGETEHVQGNGVRLARAHTHTGTALRGDIRRGEADEVEDNGVCKVAGLLVVVCQQGEHVSLEPTEQLRHSLGGHLKVRKHALLCSASVHTRVSVSVGMSDGDTDGVGKHAKSNE